MNGSATIPVVGSEFAKRNPPVSARAGIQGPHFSSKAAECVPFAVGDSLLFLYPKHPFYGVRSILEPQFIRVDRIVDLIEEPLDSSETDRQPLQIFDRFMIHGTRIDTGANCEFAFSGMQRRMIVSKPLTEEREWAVV